MLRTDEHREQVREIITEIGMVELLECLVEISSDVADFRVANNIPAGWCKFAAAQFSQLAIADGDGD